MEETLYYETIKTEVGPLTILATSQEIIRIDFGSLMEVKEKAETWFERYMGRVNFVEKNYWTGLAVGQLNQYFSGELKNFSLPYKLYGTSFQKQVWLCIERKVFYGETCTYKEIGQEINHEKAVRAIGGALNKNPISIIVPCHRVIGSSGKLVGYGGGLDRKSYLLNLEYPS